MNDRDLKASLKNAYEIELTDKGKEFIRKHERRKISLHNVVFIEMGHMKFHSCFAAAVLVAMFLLISKSQNPQIMWYVSSTLPVASLILMTGLGKSERHGMHELEASSRFSLKFVRLVRMMVIGAAGVCLIVAGSLLLQRSAGLSLLTIIAFVGTPYLLNTWGSMLVTRKWHDDNNMIGCVSVTVLSCMIPILFERALRLNALEPGFMFAFLIAVAALTVRESILFVKESEELIWNFG